MVLRANYERNHKHRQPTPWKSLKPGCRPCHLPSNDPETAKKVNIIGLTHFEEVGGLFDGLSLSNKSPEALQLRNFYIN